MAFIKTLDSKFFHQEIPAKPMGKYAHFITIRITESYPLFQTDGELNKAKVRAGIERKEAISRLAMFKRKQSTPERLTGRELLRNYKIGDWEKCDYNVDFSKTTPDCILYGFAIGDAGSEKSKVLHNYALCYALGLVDSEVHHTRVPEEHSYRYFCREQIPKYEEHLIPLNQQGIYVTPARAVAQRAILNTWKYANNNYHVEMEKTQKNIPSFGRAKEIAPESRFEFFAFSQKSLKLPKWIRLGKWMSKAEVTVEEVPKFKQSEGEFTFPYPLNPLDVMFSHRVISYDVINMPPVSLIQNVKIRGQYYEFNNLKIPAQMQYRFSS